MFSIRFCPFHCFRLRKSCPNCVHKHLQRHLQLWLKKYPPFNINTKISVRTNFQKILRKEKSLARDREDIYEYSCNQQLKSEYLSWSIKILHIWMEASRLYTTSSFDSEKTRIEFKKCKKVTNRVHSQIQSSFSVLH